MLLLLSALSTQTFTSGLCFLCVPLPSGLAKSDQELGAAAQDEEAVWWVEGSRVGKKVVWRLLTVLAFRDKAPVLHPP